MHGGEPREGGVTNDKNEMSEKRWAINGIAIEPERAACPLNFTQPPVLKRLVV
jgi:hypothetical protein